MRGKRLTGGESVGSTGLIPACAGKTYELSLFQFKLGAHPRVCGENYSHDLHTCEQRGSSPRVRGKLALMQNAVSRSRLIPACAGKTSYCGLGLCLVWAHPRVCGENWGWLGCAPHALGSSPRVRGKLIVKDSRGTGLGSSPRVRGKPNVGSVAGYRNRLIPACAGKTLEHTANANEARAHPRVCGEN